MIKNYKIITLCGSTRFKEDFFEAQKKLTLDGHIVISVGLFGHTGDDEVWRPGVKEMLDDMHLRKIAYVTSTGKTVRYLEDEHADC
ncbi:MAG: hypothetical protein IIU87_00645 [Prevotella sp.]|nr:hypothetical protein [Prevotella sp.]